MWLGMALALFYLIYLVIVVPAAALAAAVTYGLGVPVRYFMALGRVLVVRPPGLPAPRRPPRLPADADPAVLQYFSGPGRRRAGAAGRIRRQPHVLERRRRPDPVVLPQRQALDHAASRRRRRGR